MAETPPIRDALLALVRSFRLEVTFHVSTGAVDEEGVEEHELAADTSLSDDAGRFPLGFRPAP